MASPKLYKRNEVENKNNSQGAWIIIHNSVYNVTEFLNEVSIPRLLFNDGVLLYVVYKRKYFCTVTCKIVLYTFKTILINVPTRC
jgi:hypothetical protein